MTAREPEPPSQESEALACPGQAEPPAELELDIGTVTASGPCPGLAWIRNMCYSSGIKTFGKYVKYVT